MTTTTTETRFYIKVYSKTGVLLSVVTNFETLTTRNTVNASGICTFALDGDDPAIVYMTEDVQIEVWRNVSRIPSGETLIDWYKEWEGVFKDQIIKHKDGRYLFTAICIGWSVKLATREILYYAGTPNMNQFVSIPAETAMKNLVLYNAGANALPANGRVRNGTITGLSVEADSASGNLLTFSCAWKNLLEVLQKIAPVAGGDFNLVKTGPATFEFRFFAGQLGTDRTTTVYFSLERGNIRNPELKTFRSMEKTAVIVLGQGEEDSRRVRVVTGGNYSVDNNIEITVDARNEADTDAALDARGVEAAVEQKSYSTLTFEIVQTDSSRYGIHYFLGDLAHVSFMNFAGPMKVTDVEITYTRNAGETIKVGVETYG